MKKFLCMMILIATIIISGCGEENFSVNSNSVSDIRVTSENSDGAGGNCYITLADGEILSCDAKIKHGSIEMVIEGKTYTIDKTKTLSIDLPSGQYMIFFTAHNNFTGEMTLKALPKS